MVEIAEDYRIRVSSFGYSELQPLGPEIGRHVARARIGQFVYTLTEKLFTFSLGRGADWYDAPAIREAVRAARKDDYRFSTLVTAIVASRPFQMRMSQLSEPETNRLDPKGN